MMEIKQIQCSDLETFKPVGWPFQTPWYLRVFQKHFVAEKNVYLAGIYEDSVLVGYGGFEKTGNLALLLGMKPVLDGQEVTDYGDIITDESFGNGIGSIWSRIFEWLKANGCDRLQLDYVRGDSQTYSLFKSKALPQMVAPHISIPSTWDEYLVSLDRVKRKELKRKMRRLDTIAHEFTCYAEITRELFDEFVRLHKLSSREKSIFMSEEMVGFFWDLVSAKKFQWQMRLCFLKIENKYAAATLSFEDDRQTLGYNSGYDPGFNYYSAGLMLHAHKIREAIEKKKRTYDFMRGEERYKFDLGGKKLQLYRILFDL